MEVREMAGFEVYTVQVLQKCGCESSMIPMKIAIREAVNNQISDGEVVVGKFRVVR
jgi:hypothetical protein